MTHAVKLIVDVAPLSPMGVLLVQYTDTNRYDHQDGWFLPDDLMMQGEHPEDAAVRIAEDQLGLVETAMNLSHIESFTGQDGSWHIAFHYVCYVDPEASPQLADDIAQAAWFPMTALPTKNEVAHGGWALATLEEILEGGFLEPLTA